MNCRSLEEWVWQEGAGNLPAGAVEHAAACPNCRALIEHVRLLDRSVGASVTPDPDEAYWDAMAQRIAIRLDHPTDRVIQLIPSVPMWQRLVGRVWAPTMAVALLAVVASQRTTTVPIPSAFDVARVQEKIATLSDPSSSSRQSQQMVDGADEGMAKDESVVRDRSALPASSDARATAKKSVPEMAISNGLRGPASAGSQPTISASAPGSVQLDIAPLATSDEVWPERQVIIMGQVDSNSPTAPLADDRRMAGQDPFGAYERQMADAEQGVESVSTFASPGRLLDGPTISAARGSERLTPAEQMRRFDEVAELHELIDRIEDVPESSRAMSQWTQWSTAWYRLGMLSHQPTVLDSAIAAVVYFHSTVPMDSAANAEWLVRKAHLENRRENFEQ